MAEEEKKSQLQELKIKQIMSYSKLSKLFFLIGFLLIILVLIIGIGTVSLKYDPGWAGLIFEHWVYLVIVILIFFLLIEFYFYRNYTSLKDRILESEKSKPEFLDGKKVHVFTTPEDVKGGIFSKTYIEIDDHNVLRLKTLIIPPEELWIAK
jgi:hypothetical protein